MLFLGLGGRDGERLFHVHLCHPHAGKQHEHERERGVPQHQFRQHFHAILLMVPRQDGECRDIHENNRNQIRKDRSHDHDHRPLPRLVRDDDSDRSTANAVDTISHQEYEISQDEHGHSGDALEPSRTPRV